MRQKRDLTLVVLSVISLFLIAGCAGGGGDIVSGAPTTPFLGGTQGLEIGFLEGSPPAEVTDGDSFDFQALVSLKNEGEHEFGADTDMKVSLIGFSPNDFRSVATDFLDSDLIDISPTDIPTPKQRDSEGNIIEPVETFITFPKEGANFKFKEPIAGNTVFIFRADVCYKYQTKAVSEICVLANQIDVADNALCDPSEVKNIFSSGSPIRVTSFRESVVGQDKVQLSFDVEHSGSGDVFDPTVDANCPKDATNKRNNEDKVKVTVKTALTDDKLDCVGLTDTATDSSGIIKLVNGKRTITCTQELDSGRPDFRKTVDITLDFNYLDSADREVLVKHVIS